MPIDTGLNAQTPDLLDCSVLLFGALIVLMAGGMFTRYYFVAVIGGRVIADIRTAVLSHMVNLHPVLYVQNTPSEMQSRITSDTVILKSVLSFTVSIALRSAVMFSNRHDE